MAIMIREYLGTNAINASGDYVSTDKSVDVNLSEAAVADSNIDPNSLMVDIEAIHAAPYATRNYTRYTEKCLKNSLSGWTKPYARPLIKHHDEKNGDIIGRVIAAEYKTAGTFSNTPAVQLTVNIPGEQAKTDVKNGINQTVSIGVIAKDVRCSICGKQIELDNNGNVISCEHERGHVYGKETAYWDVHSMEPKEVSYVVVPSDMFAGNVRNYPATKSKPTLVETAGNIDSENSLTESILNPEINPDTVSINNNENSRGECISMDLQVKLQEAEKRADNFQAALTAMTESKSSLDAQVTDLKESLETAKKRVAGFEAEKMALSEQIKTLTESKVDLERQVAEITEANKSQEERISNETKLREDLEKELADTKVALKESLIDTLQALRKSAGKKELNADTLKNREESSIRDSIADIKLELSESENKEEDKSVNMPAPGSVTSPALAEEAEEEKKLTENAETESIDLKAGLADVFMAVARAHR